MASDKLLPEDIPMPWLSVIRRLQSVASSQGLAVVSISILVDAAGVPLAWTEPTQVKIEPKSEASALIQLALRK